MRGILVRLFLTLVALGSMGQAYPPNSPNSPSPTIDAETAVPAAEPEAWESVGDPSKPIA